jgi:hypothetical protein
MVIGRATKMSASIPSSTSSPGLTHTMLTGMGGYSSGRKDLLLSLGTAGVPLPLQLPLLMLVLWLHGFSFIGWRGFTKVVWHRGLVSYFSLRGGATLMFPCLPTSPSIHYTSARQARTTASSPSDGDSSCCTHHPNHIRPHST